MTEKTRERPKKRRQVLPAEMRVDALARAAADLFIERGIDATTVDDIVNRAGVAKGTFYHYFATKTEVVLTLRDRFSADYLSRVASAMEACPEGDHTARLRAWIRGAVATYLANYQLHDVVFHDFTHDRRRSEEKDAILDQLASVLQDGQRAGAWRVPDARGVAVILFHGMHGLVDDAIAAGQRTPEPLCDLLEDMFLRMLNA